MIPAERRRHILATARAKGVVSVAGLSHALEVSTATVRRDVRMMEDEGLLRRTRGGAALPSAFANEATYLEKAGESRAEKEAIAEAAATLVEPGDSILLGPGTTTLALANRLRTISELTVVTNSLLVIQAFAGNPGVEVVATGGILRRSIHALVGPSTEQSLASLKASRAFISGNGLTAERGLTTPNMLVATCDRALAAAGQQVIVLVDHTKVGLGTLYQTVAPSDVDVLFTDGAADADELDRLRQAGVDVRVV
jgi:DeoR/GlpR family transcriptional regulator of sugar metabolism